MTTRGESQAVNKPPYFTGMNYTYWKVKMRAFLQSIDERVWEQVEKGYFPPQETRVEGENLTDVATGDKPRSTWD